jgi:SAM-dependent methyltransferase
MDMQSFDLVRQLAASQYLVRALHVAAELGVADAIGEQAVPISDVANTVAADPDALHRILRLLASRGIFAVADGAVSHTAASRFLAASHPASLSALVRMFAQPIQWQTAGALMHSVKTGKAATDLTGTSLWDYFAGHPDEARVFDAAMAAKASVQIADLLAAHDFSRYSRVVDVGGGQGHFLRALLERHRQVAGVLFDLPPVIEGVRAAGAPAGVHLQPGDFFTSPIPHGDAILLMEVLHDWDDEHCDQILQRVRQAATLDTRLVIAEIEMKPGNGPDWPKLLDIVMLGIFAARQRTNLEYAALLDRNGFAVVSQTSTPGELTVIEARRVD